MSGSSLNIKQKKSLSLREERDRAVFEAYNQAITQNDFKSQDEACKYVRKMKAPRFYVSPEFCGIVIGRMLRGEPTGVDGEASKRKFNELFRRYLAYQSVGEKATLISICYNIVYEEAPEFYLSTRSIRYIIFKEKERQCEELRRRVYR